MVFTQNYTERLVYANSRHRNSSVWAVTGLFAWGNRRWFPRRDLHAAVGGTASRLSRLAIRDLGLISHRAETRPLSPPLSLTD